MIPTHEEIRRGFNPTKSECDNDIARIIATIGKQGRLEDPEESVVPFTSPDAAKPNVNDQDLLNQDFVNKL